MPAATRASTHGGVRPWGLPGSKVTPAVPPSARPPARRNATTSACGRPGGSVPPTPAISPSRPRMTAPTGGLGYVLPLTLSACSMASRMALILVFITEIEATKAGLGFLLWEAFQLLDTKQVFAGVVTFGLLGVASTWLLQWLERVGCPWIQRPRTPAWC